MKTLLTVMFITTSIFTKAQVGVGTTSPAAALEIVSTNSGILIPRVLLTDTTIVMPIVNPQGGSVVDGTLVYNTATVNDVLPGFYYWNGVLWERLTNSMPDGNGIYSGDGIAPTDVDVTITDNIDFDTGTLFINGTDNNVGLGTTTPISTHKLHIEDGDILIQRHADATTGRQRIFKYKNKTVGLGPALNLYYHPVNYNDLPANTWHYRISSIPSNIAFGLYDHTPTFFIDGTNERVGIFTSAPSEKLDVDGNIKASGSLISGTTTYPDYVFEKYFEGKSNLNDSYQIKSLEEVEQFIKKNKHLPGVKAISELPKENNTYVVNTTELSMQMLEKLEELFLYIIEQNKEIKKLKQSY
ncbi:MAG: hypothetical protein COA88_13960 [Kordia sp.]|nr:MAG: hypothetical protein COA88_13960 [Kordia sp.]